MRELISSVVDVRKRRLVKVQCRHCRKLGEYWVEVPDPVQAVKGLSALLDQAHGRPVERVESSVRVSSVEEIRGLSDEELARLAGP